jgi:hypothetical protein
MPPTRRSPLKALLTGLCALVLCATPVAADARTSDDLDRQLSRHLARMKKDTVVISFFDKHRWLLRDPRFQKKANLRLGAARRHLAATRAKAARTRRELARRTQEAQRMRFEAQLAHSPAKAICHVFGSYCKQALQVARCESGVHTSAQNGQYRGLFQMGSNERQLFGHGESALVQARAAYRYFVRSGRDWSPWSCKPWS